MSRQPGRTPDDTKRLILDAAAEVVRRQGTTATLDDIARQAGISKGGVVYHYANKDALLAAVVDDVFGALREDVVSRVDPDDEEPGRLMRAYVRSSLDPVNHDEQALERVALISQLMTLPSVAELAAEDTRRWEDDLAADGLPEGLRTLIAAAADGAGLNSFLGLPYDAERMTALRDRLLAMTRESG